MVTIIPSFHYLIRIWTLFQAELDCQRHQIEKTKERLDRDRSHLERETNRRHDLLTAFHARHLNTGPQDGRRRTQHDHVVVDDNSGMEQTLNKHRENEPATEVTFEENVLDTITPSEDNKYILE